MNKDFSNERNVTKKSFSDDSFIENRYTNLIEIPLIQQFQKMQNKI